MSGKLYLDVQPQKCFKSQQKLFKKEQETNFLRIANKHNYKHNSMTTECGKYMLLCMMGSLSPRKKTVMESLQVSNDSMTILKKNIIKRCIMGLYSMQFGCGIINKRHRQQKQNRQSSGFLCLEIQQISIALLLFILNVTLIHGAESNGVATPKYSQLLSMNGHSNDIDPDAEDIFRPFIPKDPEIISRNVFTPSGQFHVFQPVESDLRASLARINGVQQKASVATIHKKNELFITHRQVKNDTKKNTKEKSHHHEPQLLRKRSDTDVDEKQNKIQHKNDLMSDLRSLEDLLVEYVQNFYEKGQYEPMPGLIVELQSNKSDAKEKFVNQKNRLVRHAVPTDAKIRLEMPRTLATGRLLFLTGLKKVLWPVFMGLQVLKSLLIAMFIPAIIGSFTKLLGKGISQGSAPLFIRPMDPPQELDFHDNSLNFDDDNKFMVNDDGMKANGPYAYNQAGASQIQNQYAYNHVASPANVQPLGFTQLGMNERQHQLMQDSYMNALQGISSASFKNSNSVSGGSSSLSAPMVNRPPAPANMNTFQQFQNVPASSLLLSNYDPFYSPLLSRLDSVFAQLKLNSDNESCREKVICLMYANPAKYAPYSNLVSAQLSRELNELRKPTSDNPDILRFFKYMRAAKDGQDGVECEKSFDKCAEFKDFENPAMVSTYHDINKLVQARKLT